MSWLDVGGEGVEGWLLEAADGVNDAHEVGDGFDTLIGDAVARKGILELVREGQHHFDDRQPEGCGGIRADIFGKVKVEPVGDRSSKDGFDALRNHMDKKIVGALLVEE